MKRRGFIVNSTVLVLLIPLLLLLATYSNVTSYVIHAQSQTARLKTTQDVVSYLQLDLQNVMQLSLKRALVLSLAFVTSVEPLDNAQLALEDLVKYGTYPQISAAGPDWVEREKQLMGNTTLLNWLNNMRDYLATMGYRMVTPPDQVLSGVTLTIAPLDSFHIVANVTIPQIVIEDSSGKIIYNSSIPPRGSLYVVLPITNLEDPLVSYLTRGRLSRVIRPCNFAYPNITPPYYVLTGYGSPEDKPLRFAGPFAPVVSSDVIYYGDTYPGSGALAYVLRDQPTAIPSSAFVFNTLLNGSLVSPAEVLQSGDMGVMVFSGTTGTSGTTTWCDTDYTMRANFTLTGVSDGEVVLLKFDPSSVPFSQIRHSGPYADMRIYTSNCVPARYWIEKWDSNEVLIWLNVTGTGYSIYYSSDTGASLSRGYLGNVFGNNYLENVDLQPGDSLFLFNTTSPVFVRYNATADLNADFGGGVELELPSSSPASVLRVSLDYPDYVSDVQVPIYLNSTWASLIPHSGTEARIRVYSDAGLTSEVPFWVDYWGTDGALIWVRTDLPGDVYIRFGDDLPLTRGNGSEVFLFFDDFESPDEINQWVQYGKGVLQMTSDYVHDGNYAIEKLSNNDPNGGYRPIGFLLGRNIVLEYWDYRINRNGGPWDRVGLIDISGNGYGAALNVYGNRLGVDVRTVYGGSLSSKVIGSLSEKTWYLVQLEIRPFTVTSRVYASSLDLYFNQPMGEKTILNTAYWYFTNVYIFGGHDYAIDDIRIRKYLDLTSLTESVEQVSTPVSASFQLVDNWTTAGRLFILRDWKVVLASYPTGTWPIDEPNRYEADVEPQSAGLSLNYTHEPNSAVSETSSVSVSGLVPGTVSLYLTVKNRAGNGAHFGWVFWGPYPYDVLSPLLSAPEQRPPSGNYVSARVFDIQPFINCLLDDRYFGVAGAPSFFERLEGGNTAHRAHYVSLAEAMQKAVYGRVKYPIGLVTFILPKDLPANLNFLIRRQPAVDFIYLDYQHYPDDDPEAMQVLGISATGGIATTPIVDQNFYLTNSTAAFVFGVYAPDLLVPIGSG